MEILAFMMLAFFASKVWHFLFGGGLEEFIVDIEEAAEAGRQAREGREIQKRHGPKNFDEDESEQAARVYDLSSIDDLDDDL